MIISPASPDERSSLLSNLTANYDDLTLIDSSSSLPAEVDFPQQEGVNQELGVVKLDFKLFVSLFYDSVPGKFFFSHWTLRVLTWNSCNLNKSDPFLHTAKFHSNGGDNRCGSAGPARVVGGGIFTHACICNWLVLDAFFWSMRMIPR